MAGVRGTRGVPSSGLNPGRFWVSLLVAGILLGSPSAAYSAPAIWADPPSASTSAPAVTVPNIMGTIALHIPPNSTSTRWAKLMQASLAQPRLEFVARDLRGLPPDEQVLRIQAIIAATVRAVPGISCSDDGYWAPAEQTLARGMGDCFDVAITKMEALRLLGVPANDLYLTTGRLRSNDTAPVRETVDLLVKIGPRFWILPEWSSGAIEVDGTSTTSEPPSPAVFSPVITYGVGASWIHGRRIPGSVFERTFSQLLSR